MGKEGLSTAQDPEGESTHPPVTHTENTREKQTGMDRRQFLRRSGTVAGTVVWATPAIMAINPTPAYAASPPPKSKTSTSREAIPGLPRTGANDTLLPIAAAGAALAVAGGAATHIARKRAQQGGDSPAGTSLQ